MDNIPATWLDTIIILAKEAGEKILAIYHEDADPIINIKPDGSPLTDADKIAHACIVAGLAALTPELPVLSEESTDIPFSERAEWQRYWLVDPLDGTKEFIKRTGDFTVNIALIDNHHPVLGVVYAPTSSNCYFAMRDAGAFKQLADGTRIALKTRSCPKDNLRVIGSRRHGVSELQTFLNRLGHFEMIAMGSSLKFCRVAEGEADVYPRFGLTSEWDTAAAQCVLEQAGGAVFDTYGLPLQYNTRDSLLNPHFLAVGDIRHEWLASCPQPSES